MSALFTNRRVTHLRYDDAFEWIRDTEKRKDNTGIISIVAKIVLGYWNCSRG